MKGISYTIRIIKGFLVSDWLLGVHRESRVTTRKGIKTKMFMILKGAILRPRTKLIKKQKMQKILLNYIVLRTCLLTIVHTIMHMKRD